MVSKQNRRTPDLFEEHIVLFVHVARVSNLPRKRNALSPSSADCTVCHPFSPVPGGVSMDSFFGVHSCTVRDCFLLTKDKRIHRKTPPVLLLLFSLR